jgi:hypothetical protein
MNLINIHLDNNVIILDNKLRSLLSKVKDYDACLWESSQFFKKKYPIETGFVALKIDSLGVEFVTEYSASKKFPYWVFNYPLSQKRVKKTLSNEEIDELKNLMSNECNVKDYLKILEKVYTKSAMWQFIVKEEIIGFIQFNFSAIQTEKSIEAITHDVTVYFRRFTELLCQKILKQINEVKKFEQKIHTVNNINELSKLLLTSAILITSAQSGTIIELDKVRSKLKFRWISEKWEKINPGLINKEMSLNYSIAGNAAISMSPRIVGDKNKEPDYLSDPKMDEYISSMIQIPILYQGIVFGVVSLESEDSYCFSYPDLVTTTILIAIAAPYIREYKRIKSEENIEKAFREIFNSSKELNDLINKLVKKLECDFGSIQLIREDGGYIETIAASKNITEAWRFASRHLLIEDDIQCDMVNNDKSPRIEIISGDDNRFDNFIFNRFKHKKMIRSWIPLLVIHKDWKDADNLLNCLKDYTSKIKISEETLPIVLPIEISKNEKDKLKCIGTLEFGNFKKKNIFNKKFFLNLLTNYNKFIANLLLHMPEFAFKILCQELLQSSGASAVSIYFSSLKNKQKFALNVNAKNELSKIRFSDEGNETDEIWRIINEYFGNIESIGRSKVERIPKKLNKYEIESISSKLLSIGVESLYIYPLIKGVLVIYYDYNKCSTTFEDTLFDFGARSARRLIRHLIDGEQIENRRRLLACLETLGIYLDEKRDLKIFFDNLAKILARIFLAQTINIYEFLKNDNALKFISNFSDQSIDDELIAEYEKADNEIINRSKTLDTIAKKDALIGNNIKVISFKLIIALQKEREKVSYKKASYLIYLHFNNNLIEESIIIDWLKNLVLPILQGYLNFYEQKHRQLSEMAVVRNLAGVDPSQGENEVATRGIASLKSLNGYSGCAIFFNDNMNDDLIMEYFDNDKNLFLEKTDFPKRIKLNKIEFNKSFDLIRNFNKQTIAKVRLISKRKLRQNPIQEFQIKAGLELIMVHTWPPEPDRDEVLDIHHIVIARKNHISLQENEAGFIGNLAVHIRMAFREAREWVLFTINKDLEKFFPLSSNVSEFCQHALNAISEHIKASAYFIYAFSRSVSKEEKKDILLQGHICKIKTDINPPKNISYEKHFEIWEKIFNKETLRMLPNNILKSFEDWSKYIKKDLSGILCVPIKDPLTSDFLGVILCICAREHSMDDIGYTPFDQRVLESASEKIAIGINQKVREEELSLAAGNLGHAVKAPLHGILGFVEEANNFLINKEYNKIPDHLLNIVKLVKTADEQVLISVGKPAAEIVVSIGQMLKAIAEGFKILAKKRKIQIRLEDSLFQIPQIKIKAAKLETVLSVIIDNAIKYSDPNRYISVKGENIDNKWRMRVTNLGIAIKQENKDKIYLAYQGTTVRPKGKYMRGSGLGLAVAKTYCDELGINIFHSSEYHGRGTPIGSKGFITNFYLEFNNNHFIVNTE